MKEVITLKAEPRTALGNKVAALRRTGVMPAVLYGQDKTAQSLSIDAKVFEKVYKKAGESTLVDLQIGNEAPVKVLIQDMQRHYLTLKPIHADFYRVSMTEKLTADIPLKFIGEAPAVKELGGVLMKNLQEVKVECLPQDLVHEIEIDISVLKKFDDVIAVKSIKAPTGVTILNNPEEAVILAKAPRSEEELSSLEAAKPDEKAAIESMTVLSAEEKKKRDAEKEAAKDEKKKE